MRNEHAENCGRATSKRTKLRLKNQPHRGCSLNAAEDALDKIDICQSASALHINEKSVGGRDGFFTWLKDIFNKSAENKSRKADTAIVDRAATATTFNRSEMRLANSSDKVDVVNQKLANFCTAQSTTKFKYENIRAEKRDAKNGGHAYTIQQSAIYTTSQSNRFAAGKTFERGIEPDSLWRDLGKMYRSERNCGAIEFAARDDLDVASHYRCYTSPRHCYRLPPHWTKQPLMGLGVPNRYISMPTRALVGFAPRNTKPPIKEPNVPEKREKDEKKDKKEKKKPVIRTDSESVDSSENQAEMVASDNPKDHPDATFRYNWGVKLAKKQPVDETANDSDKFAEKDQQYVTERFWNLEQSKPATAGSEGDAEKPRNASLNFRSGDTTTDGAKTDAIPTPNDSVKKSYASNVKDTTADYLSTPSYQTETYSSDDIVAVRQDSDDTDLYMNSEELRKIIRTSPNTLKETIINEEYNIPEGTDLDFEIKAWRNLVARSALEIKENYSPPIEENLENLVSIRPEAPEPKLDVRIVKSTEDDLKDSDSGYVSPKSIEIKQVGPPKRPDGYFTGKKLHTMSTQIRYVHTNNIVQRLIGSLLSNFALDKTMQTKYPGFTDSNNTPNNRSLLPVEPQRFSSSNQEQANTDLVETLNKIADKEMEISMNQLQSTSHKKVTHSNSSKFTQRDQPRYKDEEAQEETERYEKSHVNYEDLHDKGVTGVDCNNQSTNSESVKSYAIKSTKEDSRDNSTTFDSNEKDADDNPSNEDIIDGDYIRLPGDPYPYNRENLEKWRVPRTRNLIYKPWKREMSRSSDSSTVKSTLRNANDAYANAARESRDSHVGDAVMEISGSGGDGGARKRTGQANGFRVSSRDQQVVSDCLRGDAADILGLQQWTEAFSRLDVHKKTNKAARSDNNAPFRAHYE